MDKCMVILYNSAGCALDKRETDTDHLREVLSRIVSLDWTLEIGDSIKIEAAD